jgi:hypothetical protein
MITNSILSAKHVKALKAYHRGSNWHICDAQRMAPMSDEGANSQLLFVPLEQLMSILHSKLNKLLLKKYHMHQLDLDRYPDLSMCIHEPTNSDTQQSKLLTHRLH